MEIFRLFVIVKLFRTCLRFRQVLFGIIFATANGGKKLRDGKFLGRNMNNQYDHLYLFKEDGMYKMKAGTYEVITEDYSTLFSTQPAKNAPMALYYPSPMYGQVEVFVNNNEMYTIRWNMLGQEDKYTTPIGAWGTAYKVNPFIAPVPVTGNTVRAVCIMILVMLEVSLLL